MILTEQQRRAAICDQARWGVANQAAILYGEVRPIPLAAYKARHLPLTTDCSGYVTCCYYAAGAGDPNGLGYDGQGYTGTLLTHLPHISRAQAEPGDLAVYGAYPGVHVVMLLQAGLVPAPGPLVASHGVPWAPQIMPLDHMSAGFPGRPVTFLRGVPAAPPPPARAWRVVDGAGVRIATTRHPGVWGTLHAALYRRKSIVSYHRRILP